MKKVLPIEVEQVFRIFFVPSYPPPEHFTGFIWINYKAYCLPHLAAAIRNSPSPLFMWTYDEAYCLPHLAAEI